MRTYTLAVCLFITVLAGLDAGAAKPPHKLKLEIGATYVDVERATPGGEILLIGYEQIAREYSRGFRRVEREAVASADGKARIEIGRALESHSFWLAVDLTSTGYAAMTADGRKLREGEFLSANLHKDAGGRRRKAKARFDYVHALVVRGGTGAWQLTLADGGPLDSDGALDGTIEIDAEKFEKRRNSAVLDEYRQADLLILFVPRQMGYLVTQVSE